MLKRSVGAKLRRRLLDRVVSAPVAHTRKRYDEARRLFPHQRIGNVTVYGDAAFAETLQKHSESLPKAILMATPSYNATFMRLNLRVSLEVVRRFHPQRWAVSVREPRRPPLQVNYRFQRSDTQLFLFA
jgi:hypothetical protein